MCAGMSPSMEEQYAMMQHMHMQQQHSFMQHQQLLQQHQQPQVCMFVCVCVRVHVCA